VVAPAQAIDDASAAAFGRAFYEELSHEREVATALRAANLKRRDAGDPQWAVARLYVHTLKN
jgi:CHAT domain-containing protein